MDTKFGRLLNLEVGACNNNKKDLGVASDVALDLLLDLGFDI